MLINLLRLPEPSHITGECTHLARRAVLGAGWAAGDGGLRLNVTWVHLWDCEHKRSDRFRDFEVALPNSS